MISNSSKIECIDLELEASEQQYGSEVAWQRRKFEHIQVQERQNNLNFLIGCREKMIQKFPMGFRFSPTDKELINHYVRLKIEGRDSEVDFIPEVDFYKYEPWHLPEFSEKKLDIPQWLFFCRHDGTSDYRPTNFGYWKASEVAAMVGRTRATTGSCMSFLPPTLTREGNSIAHVLARHARPEQGPRDTISVDDVKDDLNSKNLKKNSENCDENYIEGLVARDKPNVEGNRK
uniref:NAC domain-containing protein n=1 Tax=Fagus sylvatica TaxID=28930 RepID=A0A2N9IH47_FAGSY